MTAARAVEALAGAVHAGKPKSHPTAKFLRDICQGGSAGEYLMAEVILSHPWSDSQRSALVAALLAGHEGVLDDAIHAYVGNKHDDTVTVTCLSDASGVVAALGAAGREGGDRG